jgi:hypothetical protein
MSKMKTEHAERIYKVLVKYAEANSDYFESETFVYHFGVKKFNGYSEYLLNCLDGKERKFIKTSDGEYFMSGPGANRVNSIVKKILSDSQRENVFSAIEKNL